MQSECGRAQEQQCDGSQAAHLQPPKPPVQELQAIIPSTPATAEPALLLPRPAACGGRQLLPMARSLFGAPQREELDGFWAEVFGSFTSPAGPAMRSAAAWHQQPASAAAGSVGC